VSYVQLYGEGAAAALHRPVKTLNLATNDSLTTDVLLDRVRHDKRHRDALASASLVTITIGNNDWQGPCSFRAMEACLAEDEKSLAPNLSAILDEIRSLRRGAATAIRVTGYYDSGRANPRAPGEWGFDAATQTQQFEATFTKALRSLNAHICSIAVAHDATCVDLVGPFAPNLQQNLQSDHIHPSATGHRLIAKAIADTGYAPLGP
jgi:lysophospholipase L1-like esterase